MKHEEFEKQMFSCVNKKCEMQEINRQVEARAAMEEYRYICKCKKATAIMGIIVWIACFATITYAVTVFNWLGYIPAYISMATTAVVGLVSGMNVNSLANRIKK